MNELKDKDALRKQIRDVLQNRSPKNLLFYFAGHGDQTTEEEFLH